MIPLSHAPPISRVFPMLSQEDLELLGRIHAAFEYADCQGWEPTGCVSKQEIGEITGKHGDFGHDFTMNTRDLDGWQRETSRDATEGKQIDQFVYGKVFQVRKTKYSLVWR